MRNEYINYGEMKIIACNEWNYYLVRNETIT